MYRIFLNNNRFGKKCFETYNAARLYVRKYLRGAGFSNQHRTPNLGEYGFTIIKAA